MIRASGSRRNDGTRRLAPLLNGDYALCSAAVQPAEPKRVAMIRMLASVLVLLAASAASPAFASNTGQLDTAAAYQALISTSQAVAAARRAYPGADVLNARLVRGDRPYYVVRMIQDGRRFDVRVDARTGRVLN
jgi:uncharacterized membrane protein YkoI